MKEDEKQPSGFSLERFKSKRGAEKVKAAASSPRKPFKVEWVKFPLAWRAALQQAKSAATFVLAHAPSSVAHIDCQAMRSGCV